MTTKIDKMLRQDDLTNEFNQGTLHLERFMAKHHIRIRTVRRDLKDLAGSGKIHTAKLAILRKKCLGKVTSKVHRDVLSDDLMVKIILSGEPKKTEVKAEYKQEIIERITIDSTRDEDAVLSEAARILTRKRKSQSIH